MYRVATWLQYSILSSLIASSASCKCVSLNPDQLFFYCCCGYFSPDPSKWSQLPFSANYSPANDGIVVQKAALFDQDDKADKK